MNTETPLVKAVLEIVSTYGNGKINTGRKESMKTDICKTLGVKEDEVFCVKEYYGEFRVHNNKLQWREAVSPYETFWRETRVKVDNIKDKGIIRKHKKELEDITAEALGAIAKSLKKIAKEMKNANEPLEVYTLTEKGKALVEQHKNECDDFLINTPSDELVKAAAKVLKNHCKNTEHCESCVLSCENTSPSDWEV